MRCPCGSVFDFVDGQLQCSFCDTIVRVDPPYYFCDYHQAKVNVTNSDLWISVCFICVRKNNCVAHKKGRENLGQTPPQG
jgi:hypothetical protein